MGTRDENLFEGQRLTLEESMKLTAESLCAYRERFRHWAIAYSGGKDSSATVTAIVHLIEQGLVPKPESLTVLYADTRMELPPLQTSAMAVMESLRERGFEARVVLPSLDQRFFVYMFGRGVPPPKNRFRWCTSQIKIEPMEADLAALRAEVGEKLLVLTGVRLGESAARDARIALSCSRDGAECGQGWFQESTPDAVGDTLAPLIHWRICHVADWLAVNAPALGFPTWPVLEAYGADFIEGSQVEISGRTGCVGCNLTSKDGALDTLLKKGAWAYLAPYKRLRPLYAELTLPHNRLRKHHEVNKDGKLAKNQGRMGPLTMDARRYGLSVVLGIQDEINAASRQEGKPEVSLINSEERARILELIEADTWPDKWDGNEATGDVPFVQIYRDGSTQPLLMNESF
ncbi:MAG: phosphoadenosine phosphosulfate reductase family protein [Pyrinomonadaceae bacterium]